ncbi:Hypothetical protein CGLY_16440 (plasmid) [Corynebacterium glyciniphilum AJ 3170]|uniref:Uncharacterized protein n=1 Tax=Corynebacterium glyciniphilum AJ 3170 TaxID=1404245 RepID=X5EGE3_9CORY|nr:Hypothetical protein CGLY_16440 [Corynebacterium glyciniphilum AJ 3170]
MGYPELSCRRSSLEANAFIRDSQAYWGYCENIKQLLRLPILSIYIQRSYHYLYKSSCASPTSSFLSV